MNAQPAPQPLQVMLVLDTHYDLSWQHQEWYVRHTFQSFMSSIVSTLERNPQLRFSLDGQVILALWWLKDVSHTEASHRRGRLRRLVASGQLEIGPALVIPDEFLAPEMALLQNLVIGRQVSASFGVRPQRFIDMSDTFGHVAQMPQLLAGFAPYFLFSRGLSSEQADLTLFDWQAPDGSRIIAVPQQGGYQSGREFGRHDLTTSLRTVESFFERFGPRYERTNLRELLIYLRGDYRGLPEHLDKHLAALRRQYPDRVFTLGSNAEYVARLDKLDLTGLPVLTGELAGSADRFILRGVNSMRIELKQKNEEAYRTIITAETAASLALLKRGSGYYFARHDMARLWTDFLVLQSHDAITGCHSDQVFRDMLHKLRLIIEEADWIKQQALAALAGRPAVPNHDNRVGRAPTSEFSLLNLLPYVRQEVAVVPLPRRLHGARKLQALVDGRPVEVQRLGRHQAAFPVATGGFGSVRVQLSQNSHAEDELLADRCVMANEHLRVEVMPNGTLTLTDLASGRVYSGQHRFDSEGDAGDTYTFAPLEEPAYTSLAEPAAARLLANGPLVWETEVVQTLHPPKRLDRSRTRRVGTAPIKVRTLIRLRRGERQVEFDTTVVNRAEDQRLRVVFPLSEKLSASQAQTAFMVHRYPVRPALDPQWKEKIADQEPPFNAITNHGLVMAGPLYLFNRGLTEYEARHTATGSEVCLTLLRCVSHLSQGDLVSRRGQAGPGNLRVPLAQCQGEYHFSYVLGLSGGQSGIDLAQAAQSWRFGFEPTYADINTDGLLDCDPGQSVFASLAPSPDGRSVQLVHWAGAEATTVKLTGRFKPPRRLTLGGRPAASQSDRIEPYEIATFALRRLS